MDSHHVSKPLTHAPRSWPTTHGGPHQLPCHDNSRRAPLTAHPGPALTLNAAEQRGYPRGSVVRRCLPHSPLTDETPHPQQHTKHAEKRGCPHTATSVPEPQCDDHAPPLTDRLPTTLLTARFHPPIPPRMSPPPFPHLGGG
ncbi:hypothetical protein DXG01_013113, partial [Tephrocybe rancida]